MNSNILFEDFMKVDLKSFIGKVGGKAAVAAAPEASSKNGEESNPAETEAEAAVSGEPEAEQKSFGPNHNWDAEYKSRIAANKQQPKEAQADPLTLDNEFFEDFFNANFEKDIAEHLMTISLLKKDFKILGFTEANPLLAFIKLDYVKKALLKTKLLNLATFKAIHNALANKIVATSEFKKETDYNILFCQDLYKKSPADIVKYLELQQNILRANASSYSAEEQANAKRAMLSTGINMSDLDAAAKEQRTIADSQLPSVLDASTKLNSLKFIEHYLNIDEESPSEEETAAKSSHGSEKEANAAGGKAKETLKAFTGFARTNADVAVVLQYLLATTGSKKAAEYLRKIKDVTAAQLATSSAEFYKKVKNNKVDAETADSIVKLLAKKIK